MKRLLFFILVITFSSSIVYGQSLKDTKDFIIEKITANNPLPNYDNAVFFQNILKKDAYNLVGKKLSKKEFENLFVYGRDVYMNSSKRNAIISVAESIDLRGIEKVTTTRKTGDHTYFVITIYVSGDYLAKKYEWTSLDETTISYLDKMKILIADNRNIVERIKKAIIHLGKLKGVSVKDGDVF